MSREICYKSPEGQEFQAKPHVSIMKSREFPETWQVDLRWWEDNSDARIDAQFNILDGMDFEKALTESTNYGRILNVPVIKYEDTSMQVLQKPQNKSTNEQIAELMFKMQCDSVQRFSTH